MAALPLVFAPGMMCTGALFDPQVQALGSGRAVHHADFAQDETIKGMAERLLAEAPDRFFLIGLSMGGIVGFDVWRLAPDRVAGFALLNTTPFAPSPARIETHKQQMEKVRQGHLHAVVMDELKPKYLGVDHKGDQQMLDGIYAMADALGAGVFLQQSIALMSRSDSLDLLPSITCPTLILAGDEDDVCPPELHEIMHASIPESHYAVAERCGHLSSLESPGFVTEQLRSAIARVESATD